MTDIKKPLTIITIEELLDGKEDYKIGCQVCV